jgi:hypothetical protein
MVQLKIRSSGLPEQRDAPRLLIEEAGAALVYREISATIAVTSLLAFSILLLIW